MPAAIHRLVSRPDRLRRDEAAMLRQALLPFVDGGDSSSQLVEAGRTLLAHVDRLSCSSNRWTFVMLSPSQNRAVVDFLALRSKRPVMSMRLWALLFDHVRNDTGEVMMRREDIAAALGVSAENVSRTMTELVTLRALSRVREGRFVRYFMNPNVATHLGGAAREAAQASAPILSVIDGSSHPSQRRSRAAAPVVPVL